MNFELKEFNRNVEDDLLIEDLKIISEKLSKENLKMTTRNYDKYGKYTSGTISKRFGTWNNALILADIRIVEEKNVEIHKLYRNLAEVWVCKGSQPTSRDMDKAPSQYRYGIYVDRFGSWRKALKAFVESDYESEELDINNEKENQNYNPKKKDTKTVRHITQKMRFYILQRDGFRCQSCGRSPAITPGVVLHVDHIIPWSKGGSSNADNLVTKCEKCNWGKNNHFDK